jgi:hypothetical protein
MHSVLLPRTQRLLYWGYTRVDQTRLWDYSTPAGAYSVPANQPALLPGLNISTSDLWSAEHAILDTFEGHILAHGGFSPNRSFEFDPTTSTWVQVASTADAPLLLNHTGNRRRPGDHSVRLSVENGRGVQPRGRLE